MSVGLIQVQSSAYVRERLPCSEVIFGGQYRDYAYTSFVEIMFKRRFRCNCT
jgi:hypothetical protein